MRLASLNVWFLFCWVNLLIDVVFIFQASNMGLLIVINLTNKCKEFFMKGYHKECFMENARVINYFIIFLQTIDVVNLSKSLPVSWANFNPLVDVVNDY